MNNVANRPLSGNGGAPMARAARPFFSSSFVAGKEVKANTITVHYPTSMIQWADEFCLWISTRYKTERQSWDNLFPAPDSLEGQLEHMADIAATSATFNLNDSTVQTFWLEYLTENRNRLDWWRRFILVSGPCHILETPRPTF
jgi:hypothetical protein